MLLPITQIQQLEDDDEDICCKNITDRYCARPNALEDVYLAKLAANYLCTHVYSGADAEYNDDAIEENQSEEAVLEDESNIADINKITFKNGFGTMKKCKREAIIR